MSECIREKERMCVWEWVECIGERERERETLLLSLFSSFLSSHGVVICFSFSGQPNCKAGKQNFEATRNAFYIFLHCTHMCQKNLLNKALSI